MKKVLYFNNIYPLYRKPIWELLLNEDRYNFNIYYSKQDLNGIKSFNPLPEYKNIKKISHLKNYFFGGTLIWQSKVVKDLIFENFQVAIFMGDMTVISTWIGSLICKLRKKKVFFWGHGLYGNESSLKKFFRVLFQRDTTFHTRINLSEFMYEKTTTHIHAVILNINVSMSRQNRLFLCNICVIYFYNPLKYNTSCVTL